ncbi:MAG: dTDP-4-dehydrorhamnose reductase [Candidatus Marinimicrobia bacterium]|jgi:dTDP-4-dehydrorhamnose reductase|nr:dTDP-4-dehydrorhamnose reductase [Candidatus Neomarinimicrobiota bacterium]
MGRQLLVIGSNGQLGRSLQKIVSTSSTYTEIMFTFAGREQLDLSHPKQIADYFQNNRYDTIINAAAYTAVDKAESEPELADQINYQAVAQLAEIAKQHQTALLHVSTDYVFDGNNHTPYHENESPHPQSVYGKSKLKGEQAMIEIGPQGCIVRTGWLYSEFGHNFVKTMLRLAQEREQINVVDDQIGTPTYATDLAYALLNIAETKNQPPFPSRTITKKGVETYHYANEGVASWYDFAQAIFEIAEKSCKINPIVSDQYPTPAKRPHYSVLSKRAIKQQFQLQIPYWRSSLKQCLEAINNNHG